MTVLSVVRRPIVLEMGASASMLADIMARIEGLIGRASIFGFDDPQRARYFNRETLEASFAAGLYRKGFVQASDETFLPSWSFTRTGAGLAQTAGGSWKAFPTGEVRVTDRGLLSEPARTNVLTLNSGAPATTTGLTLGGDPAATLAVSNDTATLRRDGFADLIDGGEMNGNVYRLNNTAGIADAFVVLPGGTASDAVHTMSAVVCGSGTVTLRTGSTLPASASVALDFFYRRREVSQASLAAGTTASADPMILVAAPGTDLFFILPQLEAGVGATTPIITTGAAATRGADAALYEVAAPSSGGVMVSFSFPSPGAPGAAAVSWDNGGLDRLITIFTAGDAVGMTVFQGGAAIYNASRAGFSPGDNVRAFLGWEGGAIVGAVDGIAVASGSYVMPMTMDTVRPGAAFFGDQLRSYVRRVLTFDYLPTAAERLAMTASL